MGKENVTSGHNVLISPDDRYLAFSGNDEVVVYDLVERKVEWVIPHPTWKDPATWKAPGIWASALAFSPDSSTLLAAWRPTGPAGTAVCQYDLSTKRTTSRFYPGGGSFIYSIIAFRDGRILTAGQDHEIKIWDKDHRAIRAIVGQRGNVNGAAISPDERRLVTAGMDGTVRLWDIETGLELLVLGNHTGVGMGVAFSPDGDRIVSTGLDGTLRIWSVGPQPVLAVAPPPRAGIR
jgi:WD40 repeat protein